MTMQYKNISAFLTTRPSPKLYIPSDIGSVRAPNCWNTGRAHVIKIKMGFDLHIF